MKQTVRIYACLVGMVLLLSQSLLAQSDSGKSKSRLELGKKPTQTSRVINSRTFPFLKSAATSGIDRGGSEKNIAINQYYRNQLLSASAPKSTVRTTSAETNASTNPEARQPATEDAAKAQEEHMYSSDRIRVSNVYPNPANEHADIDYHVLGSVNDPVIILHSIGGNSLATYPLNRNEGTIRITTRSMDNGMYFYSLSLDGKKVVTKKLIVSHQ